jgi:hypothetical protein
MTIPSRLSEVGGFFVNFAAGERVGHIGLGTRGTGQVLRLGSVQAGNGPYQAINAGGGPTESAYGGRQGCGAAVETNLY